MNDCYCSWDDTPSYFWETYPKARKEYICSECGSKIDKGEKYQRITCIWDDELITYKTCEVCWEVRDEYLRETGGCVCFESLWETVGIDFEQFYSV